jgi:hypothetical protein
MSLSIAPKTDGTFRLTVFDGDTPVDTATVTASIYAPTGIEQASEVVLSPVGGGTGAYALAWQSAWTQTAGEFVAVVTAIHGGLQRVRRFRIAVQYDDTE